MEEMNKEIVNSIIELLGDNKGEKVVIFKYTKTGGVNKVFDIIDSKTVLSGSLEYYNDYFFDNPGIYVYRFKGKELTDYRYICVDIPGNELFSHVDGMDYVILYKLYVIKPLEEKSIEKFEKALTCDSIYNRIEYY